MFADDTTIPLPAMYIDTADPAVTYTDGRVKAGRLWLDTSTGTIGTLKKRNAANDGWDTLIDLDAPAVTSHASTHENGGTDEIDVTGLSGVLADPQVPGGAAGGDLAGTYPNPTLAGTAAALSPATATLTDGATITWATAGARQNNARVTLGGNRTLDITGEVDGATGLLIVIQDGTGGRTLALPAGSKVINDGSGAVTLSTGAGDIDILTWYYDGTNFFWTIGTDYS